MESRITNILYRMNQEKCKLDELRKNYVKCEKMCQAGSISITADIYKKGQGEHLQPLLSGPIVKEIMELIRSHYLELGHKYNDNLESMVEELKEGGE